MPLDYTPDYTPAGLREWAETMEGGLLFLGEHLKKYADAWEHDEWLLKRYNAGDLYMQVEGLYFQMLPDDEKEASE